MIDKRGQLNATTVVEKSGELDDETRSMRSEFDYSTKKKFVEMVSRQNKTRLKQSALDELNSKQGDKPIDEERLS